MARERAPPGSMWRFDPGSRAATTVRGQARELAPPGLTCHFTKASAVAALTLPVAVHVVAVTPAG